MTPRILITGSCGLVGTGLTPVLEQLGAELRYLDIVAHGDAAGDVKDASRVCAAVEGCDGVIHLAAVSRVIWGEQQPELCWATNVGGLRNVLASAAASSRKPWVIFASSREVYGQPAHLPADESCPLSPVNIYGRSKIEGEALIEAARHDGVRACTIRLSNVFGSTQDHTDRVVPAFARTAALGGELRVDGASHTFDFTHIDDVAAGIAALVSLLTEGGAPPPPIHFVSGVPTTLQQLAELAIRLASSTSVIRHAPPRSFDVAQFVGSPERAKRLLGWTPTLSLETGLQRLINDFRSELGVSPLQEAES
jgi:nucleoside-diphosphate-sugar epimerase